MKNISNIIAIGAISLNTAAAENPPEYVQTYIDYFGACLRDIEDEYGDEQLFKRVNTDNEEKLRIVTVIERWWKIVQNTYFVLEDEWTITEVHVADYTDDALRQLILGCIINTEQENIWNYILRRNTRQKVLIITDANRYWWLMNTLFLE